MSGQLHAPAALLSTKQLVLPIEQEAARTLVCPAALVQSPAMLTTLYVLPTSATTSFCDQVSLLAVPRTASSWPLTAEARVRTPLVYHVEQSFTNCGTRTSSGMPASVQRCTKVLRKNSKIKNKN
jgi:hypothetical protein